MAAGKPGLLIAEAPWNDSCLHSLLALVFASSATPRNVTGGPTGGGSSVVLIRSPPTQQQPPCRATSAMRWVTLVTFSIGA